MNKIKKLWGIGLVLVLLASMFVMSASPVAAGDLRFTRESAPSTLTLQLAAGTNIVDMAIASDGTTIYAASGAALYKSTNAGVSWVPLTTASLGTANDMVAVSPDNVNLVIAADGTAGAGVVMVSQNGGTSFSNTSLPAGVTISDITIAPVSGPFNYITVAGTSGANTPFLSYFNLGATIPAWTSTVMWNAGLYTWGATADVTVAFTETGDTLGETYTFTYTNEFGVAGRTGTAVVPSTAAVGVAVPLTLQGADAGIRDITNVAAGIGAPNDATAGSFQILGADGATVMATYTFTGAITDGAANPGVTTTDAVRAIGFSPNFASDQSCLVITEDVGIGAGTGMAKLQQVNFNGRNWNSFGTPYPVTIATDAGAVFNVNAAAIAMAPDYLGADEVMRVNFVALAYTAAAPTGATGFVKRYNDGVATTVVGGVQMNSVAFDGTNLVAGAYITNDVYRCANSLATFPSALPARTFKKVGIDDAAANDAVLVGFAGANVVAAKTGDNSCFSVSRDLGLTFNDISMMDTTVSAVDDFAVSSDGAYRYLVTQDVVSTTPATSVFRFKDGAWERVLIADNTNGYIARTAPENMDVIYIADSLGTAIWYSSDAGNSRWYTRAATGPMTDLAVESANSIYVGIGGTIVKSTNGGFTWGIPAAPTAFTGNVYSINVISTGNIVVGSTTARVSYTTDGGATWSVATNIGVAGNAVVDASGLATGDSIFAIATGTTNVYRWTIGTNTTTWTTLTPPAAAGNSFDVVYENGALYRIGSTGAASQISRSINPTAPVGVAFDNVAATDWPAGTALVFNGTAPDTVKVTNGNTLWAIDTATTNTYSYKDIFAPASAAPKLSAPANSYLAPVNVNGVPNGVTFSWAPVTGAVSYQIDVAFDQAFLQTVPAIPAAGLTTAFQIAAPVNLTPGQTYYWRVRVDAPVRTHWSEVRVMTVQPSQAMVPVIGSPANGSTVTSQSPGFSWTPITGTTAYKFEVSSNAAFATTIYTDEVTTSGAQLPITIKLEKGKQYFWRVKSLTPVEGEWSTVGNFMVAEEVVTPTPTATQPQITITTQPAPTFTIPVPDQTTITVEQPDAPDQIAPAYIWAIIVIGAILVIAMIVLIVRTRRSV